MNTSTPLDPRSLAHRLTSVGHALHHRLFAQLRDSDLHPKTVFLLRAIDGRIDAPWVAERLARGGKRVSALADRGWITSTDDGWALTDEGRAALDRLDADRSALLADVPADELERLVAALDTLEGALGLDAESGDDRRGFGPGFGPRGGFGPAFGPGFGPRGGFGPFSPGMRRGFDPEARGFDRDADGESRRGHGGPHGHDGDTEHAHGERGPRHGRGFGPGFGPGFGQGHGRGHGERGHGFGPGFGRGHGDGERGHGRGHRAAQRAYERGFDAGFSRGRESTASGTPSDTERGPVAE